MKILVTGASGLVGSHLIKKLGILGYEVERLHSSISSTVDFTSDWNFDQVSSIPDCIIHLAQSPDFRLFPEKAVDIFHVNTLSTLKLVDWAQKNFVSKFIFASSGGIYGFGPELKSELEPIKFDADLGFYLTSKYCSELILDNYSSFLTIIQLRLFFVYGRGQRKDMLIPRLIENVRSGIPITIQNNGGMQTNPTHVSDVVNGIISSLKLKESNTINLAGPETISIQQMVNIIGDKLNCKPTIQVDDKKSTHLIPDLVKMKELLGESKVKFEEGILDCI